MTVITFTPPKYSESELRRRLTEQAVRASRGEEVSALVIILPVVRVERYEVEPPADCAQG